MNKYKTANGTIATEQELRDYYGGKFDDMLASGVFIKVEEDAELKKKVDLAPQMAPQQGQPTNANQPQNPYMASPSEGTSSELPSSGTDNSFFKKPYAPPVVSDISNIGVPKFEQKKTFQESQKEIPTKIKGSIESVTPELINSTEESVVPQMNYQFGDLGFKFEESGATGDWMKATAPNGKSIEVSLDPFMSSTAVSESKKLKDFIKQNTAQLSGLDLIEKQYQNENKKFLNQKEVDDSIKKINSNEESLNSEIKSFIAEKNNVDKELKDLENTPQSQKGTQEYLDKLTSTTQRKLDIQSKQYSISEKIASLPRSKEELNQAAGKYAEMKSEQGTWYGVIPTSLASGVGAFASWANNLITDIGGAIAPDFLIMDDLSWKKAYIEEAKKDPRGRGIQPPKANKDGDVSDEEYKKWMNSLRPDVKDELHDIIVDKTKKEQKYTKLDNGLSTQETIRKGLVKAFGDPNTSEQYIDSAKKGVVTGALIGALESVPSFIGGGGGYRGAASRLIRMYAQSEDAAFSEMEKNPAFDNVSENEKRLVSTPISIANAALEEIGFRNVIANKGVFNKVILGALGKAGATTTAKTFGELVKYEVNGMVAKGLLTLAGASLAEAETGATQQVSELAVKDIYNSMKGKTMFDTPKSISEYIESVGMSALQEAIGGLVMGAPSAISAAYTKSGFLGMSDESFKVFEKTANDDKIQTLFVTKLKNLVNSGELTMAEAKEQLNDYRNSVSIYNALPEGLDTQGKKEAMNLIKEKRGLEQSIEGKDPSLVKKQQERIDEINDSLTKISEDAIQKQTTDESVLRTGESKVGLQEMGEGNTQLKGTSTGIQETLTDDEQKRKTELEEALKEPNTQNGTVTIGDQSMTIEDAQKELDAFNKPTPIDQELTKMEERFGEQISSTVKPTTDQGVSVTNKSAIDDIKTKITDQGRVKVIEAAQRVLKTVKSVLPNFDIVLHNDEGSYNAAMTDLGGKQGTRGNFFDNGDGTGRIDINLSKADSKTVAHEVAHGIMLKAFGDTPALFKGFRDKISKVLNESSNKELMDFAAQYEGDVTYEEYLAELTGRLEQQQDKLSTTTLQKIAVAINEVVSKLTNGAFKPFEDIKDTKQIVDFFNNISQSIRKGEEISGDYLKELNSGGEVGTFKFGSKSSKDTKKAPSVSDDSRSFIKDLVEDIDIKEFNGMPFVTNMYDYTTVGETDLGNGFKINMLGGKNYVPYMMSLKNKKLGDVSNLAAFNSQAQAESFIRNAKEGKASLFAPHSGTLSNSWQFQQHTFAELINLITDKGIMSESELIDTFNKTIESNSENKAAFKAFKDKYAVKYGNNIRNFSSFKSNPKKIVELLDIENNYSPDLRKALNNAIAADKIFQKAIGVKNKEEFFNRIMDPLNKGVEGGEIINVIKFDPNTFKIVKTKADAIDHHPSFGWSLLAKINGIYQPTDFYKSSDVTESYTKYNKSGAETSRKAQEPKFEQKNVASSAGAIPKIATFATPKELDNIATDKVKEFASKIGIDLGNPKSKSQISDSQKKQLPVVVANGYDILKKKFGETASKKIRQFIPFALDYPNEFATFISNKIPEKEDIPFIVEHLGKRLDGLFRLETDKTIDVVEENNKTPEELSKEAGYVFHRPKSVDDILVFKKDFDNGEVLCTFNNVEGRERDNFIFWLRRNDAETVLPAKKLTQEYLSEDTEGSKLWRNYLDKNGRKNEDGSYNLSGIEALRQDPYGTSSMSVQIGRRNGSISIKNRYNHTVSNPDATFGNDLNKVIDGLNEAVFNIEGVPKKSTQELSLPDQIVSDNKGRFFRFDNEFDGIYFSKNGYMKDGEITLIDKSSQRMIDQYLFDSKSKKITSITNIEYEYNLGLKNINKISFEKDKIDIKTEDGDLSIELIGGIADKVYGDITKIGNYFLSNNQTITSVDLPSNVEIKDNFLQRNLILTSINLPSNVEIGNSFLSQNLLLESIDLPKNNFIGNGFLLNNQVLTSVNLPLNKNILNRFLNRNISLESISLPSNQTIGDNFLNNNEDLKEVDLPENQYISKSFLLSNRYLKNINLPKNKGIGAYFLYNNIVLKNIDLPSNINIGDMFLDANLYLNNINLPNNTYIGYRFLANNESLETLDLPNNTSIGDRALNHNKYLVNLILPSNISIGSSFLVNNTSLKVIDLPSNISIDDNFLLRNKDLISINLPSNTFIGRNFLMGNEGLKEIDLPKTREIGDNFLISNIDLINIELPSIKEIGTNFLKENKNRDNVAKSKSQVSTEVNEMNKKFTVSKSQITNKDVVEKIINDARAQGFSEQAIKAFLERKGLDPEDVNAAMKRVAPPSGKITLSEQTLPGYDRMMQEVDSIIRKSQQRGASNAKVIENVMNYVKGSLVYEKATDVQREKLVRDVNAMLGVKEKSAPSVGKILSEVKDLTKITMTEKQGLIKQIRDLARGAKDAKTAIAVAYEQLSKEIKELRGKGKLTVNQAANVLRKFSKVNVLSKTSVDRFTDYMTKVFEKADYASKLSDAKKLKQSIAKLSKNKEKNADLRELGRQFSEIDPSMVEDIEEYNEIAAQVKESIQGSTIKKVKEKGEFAEIVNIGETSSYIKDVMDAQNEKIREERIAEIQDLMGIDASKFSAEEMLDLLNGDEKVKVNDEKSIKETAKNAFRIYSSIIRNMINTGIDSFTGEEVEFTKKQKELVSSFIDMDLNLLDAKESVAAVDALTIFLQNNSTAKMEDVVSQYTGELNIRKLVKEGKIGIALRKLWSGRLSRSLTEGGTTLPEVFTKIFKGARAGLYVATASGFNKIVNGNARANTRIQDITKDYIEKFFKTKPNGEKFNTAYNDAERGIVSDLMRSVIGTESEMQKEFERRKKILNQSIEVLLTGTKEDQKKGKIYKKVYNNIVKGSDTVKDIEKKVDKTNLEAINFWMKTLEEIFPELYDYMLNVRNTMLEKDLNYSSPDRYVRLSQEKNKLLTEKQPMYGRNGELLIKKEAGGLMKADHPDNLPKGMYRDYSFDKNNVNSLHDVLVDMNTGAAIRQLDAFKNSDYFDKLIPTAEDRDLLRRRFALYVSNIRNAGDFGGQDLGSMMKILDRLATIGVGMALGSPTQVIKQTVPLGINTMVNASGLLKLGAAFNPAFNNFYHNSGYASANRGVESQAEISSLNKKIETASNKVELLKAIEDANKWWLKTFLVKPDVFIARASWQTFYEQELRKQGVDTNNLDYSDLKLNEDAADYAEMMVSRQQNVSDHALSGSWFTKNTAERRILTKVFLNMANFRMNTSSRLAADLSVLGHWSVSTAEDKAIAARSIAGYAAEQAVYRMISTGLIIGLGSIALGMRGDDESEEDKKKRINSVIKGQLTSSVMDIFSPAPFLDVPIKEILSPTLSGLEKATGLPLSIYGNNKQDYSSLLGGYGIAIQRGEELYDVIKLGTTGKYKDEFGKEKQISEEDQKIISELMPFSVGTVLGIMPSEIATITRDMVKFSKKKSTSDEEAAQKIEDAENKQEGVDQKVEVLEKLNKKARNKYEKEAIEEKITELEASKEEKKVIKEANAEEKQQKEELLTNPVTGEQYDNESKLKKYNPRLYNKNFGVRSQWFKDHKYEKLIEKKMNAEIIKMEDREHNYRKPTKTTSKKRNSDGSFKRVSYKRY